MAAEGSARNPRGVGGPPPSDGSAGGEDLVAKATRQAPPWLISAIVHMLVLIVLGLIFLPTEVKQVVMLEAVTYAEKLGKQLDDDSPSAGNDENPIDDPILTPDNLPPVVDPFAAPPQFDVVPQGNMASSNVFSPQIGMALSGRQPGSKERLLADTGGTRTTQSAVEAGLAWLARNQDRRSGAWSLKGPFSGGGLYESREAATAMAMLAFQGNGQTHLDPGPYRDNVRRGLDFLLAQQDDKGCLYQGESSYCRFYAHSQCTIAICELYAMTHDPKLRKPAEEAVRYLLETQGPQGGWKYEANEGVSDVSVTGWVVMALQSARMAGLKVPADHFQRVAKFLAAASSEGGSRYGYQIGHAASPSMTAEALLCRQYMGWKRDDRNLKRGVAWITSPENLINYDTNRDVYFWYYATQVAHHMGGDYWRRWNTKMRQAVPSQQVKQGAEAGSWAPSRESGYDQRGGRLYVTCLSIYMLEVYYRHLPLYQDIRAGGGS